MCITSRPCFVNQYIHSVRYSTTVSRITEQYTSDGDGLVMGLTVEPNRHVVPCRPLLCRVFFSYTSLVCHSTPVMCVTVHVRRGRLGDGRDGEPGRHVDPLLCCVLFRYTCIVCYSTPVLCVSVHVRRGRLGDGRDGEPGRHADTLLCCVLLEVHVYSVSQYTCLVCFSTRQTGTPRWWA